MTGQVFFLEQLRAVHPNGPVSAAFDVRFRSPHDFVKIREDGGTQSIKGVTSFDGVPGAARVYLLERINMRVIQDIRTGASGVYEFTNLPAKTYVVLAIDETNQDNAVVRDRVSSGGP